MGDLWLKLKVFLAEAFTEMAEASAWTAMWVEGYTDFEIEQAINDPEQTS